MKLVTVAEMRALEAAAVEAGISERQLMEEAGLAVAQEGWMLLGTLEGQRIVALAGPGSNGGDAIVAAKYFFDWGADVTLAIPRRGHGPSLADDLEGREIPILRGDEDDEDFSQLKQLLAESDLILDGLLGIGQKRPLDPEEPLARALVAVRAARNRSIPPKLLAIDLPTGINADTGAVDPLTVAPDVTVTFGLPKVGLYQGNAGAMTGRIEVIDIGIPKAAQDAIQLELMAARWARGIIPARPQESHKGTYGRVIVVGGSRRYIGAPRLVAEGAYRAGAGLVSIACPEEIVPALAASIAEAIWLPQAPAMDGGFAGASALALRPEWAQFDAAVVGPGMGRSAESEAFLWAVLSDISADVPRGAVFDADALSMIAAMPDAAARLPARAVLTPHPGEMARLLGVSSADVQSRRLEACVEAAQRYGCVVVLKGAHTVVAAPDGRRVLSPFANPLMATAGAGDVLAGIIGGYLAQGADPFDAAGLGVYVHAAAGESLRLEYGEAGLLAGELAARTPRVVRELRAI